MGLYEGRGNLGKLMKDLRERWHATRMDWDDEQARRFEELKVDHEGRSVAQIEPLDTAVRPLTKLTPDTPPQVRLVAGDEA